MSGSQNPPRWIDPGSESPSVSRFSICGQFGGGGGGRIALYTCDQQINGANIEVLGGLTSNATDGAPGTLFLRTNPVITSQPASGSVCSQTQALLAVRAIGPGTLTYQWQLRPTGGSSFTDVVDGPNDVDGGEFTASGAHAATLVLSSGTLTAGNFEFRCAVSNGCGATESHTASFRVCAADYNCDGTLNADDLSDFITGYFNNPADATTAFNQDGVINADDLGDFITAYFNGC